MRYTNDPEYATQMTDPKIQTVRSDSPPERGADQDAVTLGSRVVLSFYY